MVVIMEMVLLKINDLIKPLITITIIILLWFYVSYFEIFNQYLLPSPIKVMETFIEMCKSGEMIQHILVSLKRVIIGFSIAFISAFIFALLFYRKPKIYPYFSFIIEFMRNVPPLALIPLLILWFGIGESTKIVIIFLASFFPIFLNIEKGFVSCDKQLIEVGKTLDMNENTIFKKIVLPYAVGDILVGMRIGLGYSWRAIIGAEMVAAASGLGYMILFAQQLSRSDKVIIGILVIGIIGWLCDLLFKKVIKKTLKEQLTNG